MILLRIGPWYSYSFDEKSAWYTPDYPGEDLATVYWLSEKVFCNVICLERSVSVPECLVFCQSAQERFNTMRFTAAMNICGIRLQYTETKIGKLVTGLGIRSSDWECRPCFHAVWKVLDSLQDAVHLTSNSQTLFVNLIIVDFSVNLWIVY